MSNAGEDRVLWRAGSRTCVMISCCAGAELQIREEHAGGDEHVVLRELYPTKSDLYERARALEGEYR